ncbi:MAG: 3-deoxy-D-manno-octulosonic acid transferase [Rhodospirillaceae bacterium]|nr:3-deoxy-D-manno-octulosonic acid transferase [Rhodospirillaceae bacterium]
MSGLALYRGFTRIGMPMARLLLRRRLAKGKEDAARIGEREGIASLTRPEGPVAWLHAASVGEAQSALILIEKLLSENRELRILVTTGTVTSASYLKDRLPNRAFHQYLPLDCPQWVNRFLNHWKPDIAIWMESEFWPNLIVETKRRDIPALLVNARMSANSLRAWQRMNGMAKYLISGFRLCLAQTEYQAELLQKFGAMNVSCVGNLKYSAAPLAVVEQDLEALQSEIGIRPVWVAASTHAGEEVLASNAHTALLADIPELLTIIVPRHPSRAANIETTLSQRGHNCIRRSTGKRIELDTAIYIADTLGELGLFYRLARISYIGGSMSHHGGHNPLEAAQLGCAVIHGPDMDNFSSVAAALASSHGSVVVGTAQELAHAIRELFEDREFLVGQTARAAAVAETNRGVVDSVYAAIAPAVHEALRGGGIAGS